MTADETKLLDRWEFLKIEVSWRLAHTDVDAPGYADGFFEALMELCFVEDALGLARIDEQETA